MNESCWSEEKLGKDYYKVQMGVFWLALLVCGAARIMLKLRFMDVETGFYTRGTGIATVFNICLLLAVLVLFISSRLRKTEGEHPVAMRGGLLGVLGVLAGVSILLYTFLGEAYPVMEQGFSDTALQVRDLLSTVLGALAGLSLIWVGAGTAANRLSDKAAIPALLACVWQLYMLMTRFNGFTVLTTISDNLLAVLFMVFAALFLVGHARVLFGLARADSRSYALPAALCAALTGFLLVIPNYLYALINGGGIPAPMLGFWESVYVLVLSIYALLFAVVLLRSIKQV